VGAWRPIDEALERAGLTFDTAPLTDLERTLERARVDYKVVSRRGELSPDPRAVQRRYYRRRARKRAS
jgi:hypothetical protein